VGVLFFFLNSIPGPARPKRALEVQNRGRFGPDSLGKFRAYEIFPGLSGGRGERKFNEKTLGFLRIGGGDPPPSHGRWLFGGMVRGRRGNRFPKKINCLWPGDGRGGAAIKNRSEGSVRTGGLDGWFFTAHQLSKRWAGGWGEIFVMGIFNFFYPGGVQGFAAACFWAQSTGGPSRDRGWGEKYQGGAGPLSGWDLIWPFSVPGWARA